MMELKKLLAGVDIVGSNCEADMEIDGIVTDSRKASAGMLFVALPGLTTDKHGRQFISAAIENGAAAVVTDEPCGDVPYVIVRDTERALTCLASAFYGDPAKNMKIIGVTGTKGKTSVTHYIKNVLDNTDGVKAGLIGTNHIVYGEVELPAVNTTPEPVSLYRYLAAMRDAGCTHVVMEVSSHSLATGRTDAINFAAGVFLNLSQDHLDYHGTMDEYAAAKALLFKRSECSVINADDARAGQMISAAAGRVLTFGITSQNASLVAKDIRYEADHVEFQALVTGEMRRIRLNAPGHFSVQNGLAVIGALLAVGLELDDIARLLSDAKPVPGRAEIVYTGLSFTTIVDYAHSPGSLEEILDAMRQFAKKRLITVFGCGGNRDRTKRPMMCAVVAKKSDFYVVTSDNPRDEEPDAIIQEILQGAIGFKTPYAVQENRREAIRLAMRQAEPDDIVIIAGKGHEDYQEINGRKHHFDDRETVLEIAADMKRKA